MTENFDLNNLFDAKYKAEHYGVPALKEYTGQIEVLCQLFNKLLQDIRVNRPICVVIDNVGILGFGKSPDEARLILKQLVEFFDTVQPGRVIKILVTSIAPIEYYGPELAHEHKLGLRTCLKD